MLPNVGQALRVVHISLIFFRHGIDELIFFIPWLKPFRFLLKALPWNWFRDRTTPWPVRLRLALERLGPIFIKLGQMLSTRRDLLPDAVAFELTRLQDKVPPFSSARARAIIAEAYGQPVTECFARFDDQPLASASIAQVHTARLFDGQEVVVKIVRPTIQQVIRRDLDLMYVLAGLIERYWPEARRFKPRQVVEEYERTIFDELDLIQEASNASQIRRNFEDSHLLYIPAIHWDYCRREVMVMERIRGIQVNDIEALKAEGVDLRRLSEKGVEIFFTQVFQHNFFHADMHPGNIFVDPALPDDPRYMAVDFGIIGTLSPADQRYLAENFVAFFNRDYQRVAELHVESGWVAPDTRVDQFESAIRSVCEPIFQRPLKEISFAQLLLRLFQTARRYNMEVQPQLVLLQKTLLHIEGLGRQLAPDLDLWTTAKPFLERWMSEQIGVRASYRNFRRHLPAVMERAPLTLDNSLKALEILAQNRARMEVHGEELQAIRHEIRAANRRTVQAIAGGALLVVAVFLPPEWGNDPMELWLGVSWQTVALTGIGLVLLWQANRVGARSDP